MFRRNSAVDEVVIANVEVVDHRGVIVNLCYLGRRHTMTAWMRVAKISCRHKRETVYVQTKIESNTDVAALVKETNAFLIHRKWR